MRESSGVARSFNSRMRLLVLAAVLSAYGTAAQAQCVGDCQGDGSVNINDLILGVNIALGLQPATACPAFQNAQGQVDIAQLIKGVSNALGGCPGEPTATATATGPETATSTATPVATATSTATAVATATDTSAVVATSTATPVATATHTSASATATATPVSTSTHTSVVAATATATHTTSTATATRTVLSTPSSTRTASSTATATRTSGSTATRTATTESTATATATPVSTATVTHSLTASSTPTVTATPSATATATRTRTPTETPVPVGELIAGHAAIVSTGLRSVQPVIAALVSQATNSGNAPQAVSSPLVLGLPMPEVHACSVDGTSERTCMVMGADNDKSIHLLLDANFCIVAAASGETAQFNGKITLDSNPSNVGACDPVAFSSGTYQVGDPDAPGGAVPLDVVFRDAFMEPTLGVSAELSGMVSVGLPPPPSCLAGTLTLTIEGLISSQLGDSSSSPMIEVRFFGTEVTMDMITYNADCVPLSYRLKFNGSTAFSVTEPGPALVIRSGVGFIPDFSADLTNLFLTQQIASGSVTTNISGKMSSDCFGGDVQVATLDSLVVGASDLCPNAGQLSLTSSAGPATVTYDGSQVNVVQGGDEKVFPSCLADDLVTCIPQ